MDENQRPARWVAQNEDGTYAVGEGDAEIATCKNRDDAMLLKREWVGLTDEEIWTDGSTLGLSAEAIRTFVRNLEAKLKEKNT